MSHVQPEAPPGPGSDARVGAAAAHWGYRFTSNGTDYADFTATLARITRWADWCREWGVTAARYEQLKRELADRYLDDRDSYTEGKSAFITAVLIRERRGEQRSNRR